jgi:hypothetical protein
LVDPLEGCIAETLEFDIRLGTLLKDVGFELTTLNTGLLVKDAPCPEFLEGTGLLSAFNLSSTLCNIDPSSLRDCEILERQTTVLEIYFASLCLNILLDKQPKVAYSNLLPLSQKTSHSRIQSPSQKTICFTPFSMCMQQSISAKYGS